MFQTVNLFNDGYAIPYYGGPLEIGIGLHAGKVFVGEFGLDDSKNLSVMGLPVNIASRLQAKTKEVNNDLLISEEAYQLITDNMAFNTQTVSLKGISHSQKIHLAGKPYNSNKQLSPSQLNFDYLLAISG